MRVVVLALVMVGSFVLGVAVAWLLKDLGLQLMSLPS